jgi:hypothetical protein
MRRFGYQNAVLSAIAVLLALGLIDRRSGGELASLPAAHAQQPDQGGMMNALEQRKVMIAELRNISSRLERLEAKLNAGLNVKVTSMPAAPNAANDAKPRGKNEDASADPKPAPSK